MNMYVIYWGDVVYKNLIVVEVWKCGVRNLNRLIELIVFVLFRNEDKFKRWIGVYFKDKSLGKIGI